LDDWRDQAQDLECSRDRAQKEQSSERSRVFGRQDVCRDEFAKERQAPTTGSGADQDGIDLTRRRKVMLSQPALYQGSAGAADETEHGPHSISQPLE
jgi:hypothetical protein